MSKNKANNGTAKEQCLNKTIKKDINICWTHFCKGLISAV